MTLNVCPKSYICSVNIANFFLTFMRKNILVRFSATAELLGLMMCCRLRGVERFKDLRRYGRCSSE